MELYRTYPVTEMEYASKGKRSPWIEVGTLSKVQLHNMVNKNSFSTRVNNRNVLHKYSDTLIENVMATVFDAYADRFNVDVRGFDSKSRETPYADGRSAYCYFARRLFPKMRLDDIAATFKNIKPHHSTIIHGSKMTSNLIAAKDDLHLPILESIAAQLKIQLTPTYAS